jgi:hypothetical protein
MQLRELDDLTDLRVRAQEAREQAALRCARSHDLQWTLARTTPHELEVLIAEPQIAAVAVALPQRG